MIHEEEEKKHTRRGWKILGGMFASVLAFGVLIFFSDDALEDAADIMPHFPAGETVDSAFPEFLRELRENPVEDFGKLPNDVRARKPGTEAELRAYVNRQSKAQDAFRELMQSDTRNWRWPGIDDEVSLWTDTKDALRCQSAGHIQSLLNEVLVHENRRSEALEVALQLIRFGHVLQSLKGGLLHWVSATSIQSTGEEGVERALSGSDNLDPQLKKVQEIFGATDYQTADFEFALRTESASFRNTIRQLQTGIHSINELGLTPWQRLTFRPNRTLNSHLGLVRPIVKTLPSQSWEGLRMASTSWREFDAWKETAWEYDSTFQRRFNPNRGGRYILGAMTFGGVIDKTLLMVTLHRQRMVILALRRFELAHAQLPNSLEELVPDYLPAVPKDPYDNASMKWSPSTWIVYSVGSNLVDDHGTVATRDRYGRDIEPDLGLRYWWAPPEKK